MGKLRAAVCHTSGRRDIETTSAGHAHTLGRLASPHLLAGEGLPPALSTVGERHGTKPYGRPTTLRAADHAPHCSVCTRLAPLPAPPVPSPRQWLPEHQLVWHVAGLSEQLLHGVLQHVKQQLNLQHIHTHTGDQTEPQAQQQAAHTHQW